MVEFARVLLAVCANPSMQQKLGMHPAMNCLVAASLCCVYAAIPALSHHSHRELVPLRKQLDIALSLAVNIAPLPATSAIPQFLSLELASLNHRLMIAEG